MPSISIILPVYNAQDFLPACLDSILAQTHADFELIAVDDASTDRSVEILRRYAARDRRINILQKAHSGLGNTRNHGIEHAAGDYLLFVDADDRIAPDALARLYAIAKEKDRDLVFFNFIRVAGEKQTTLPLPFTGTTDDPAYTQALLRALIGFEPDNPFYRMPMLGSAWRRFVKRALFTEHDIRFPDERAVLLEDLPTSIRLHRAAKSVALTDAPLYLYRYNPNSLTTAYRAGKFEMLKRCFARVKSDLTADGDYAQYAPMHRVWFLRFAVHESLVNLFSPAHKVPAGVRYRELCAILSDPLVRGDGGVSMKGFPRADRLLVCILRRFPKPLVWLFYRLYARTLT